MMKKNKNLVLMLSFIASMLFIVNCGSGIEAELKEASAEINAQCPMTIDAFTRLDNTEVLPGKIFQYNYTLTTEDKAVLGADPVKFASTIKAQVIPTLKNNPALDIFRDNDVTLVYIYNKPDGTEFFRFEVLPENY
ncbi:MAG: hypothetical protein ABUK01_09555 [Leptospirales bacterium]